MAFPSNPLRGNTHEEDNTLWTYNGATWDRSIIRPGNATLYSTGSTGTGLNAEQKAVLDHWRYDSPTRKLISDRAIETKLNALYLGEQHKMSSGSENIYFTNLGSGINFFPMWGGLKDQSQTVNQDGNGFIPPSGRVYTDMFSTPLGGNPDPLNSIGYAGDNYFGVNITGVGITTVAGEAVGSDVRLEYRIIINGRTVYNQDLPRNAPRSTAGEQISAGDVIEWWFEHPVDVHAGTTLYAEIRKFDAATDADLGVFLVRQGDTPDPNTGLYRYQAIVHNRLFEDKDLELISPYLKYQAMDFQIDPSGSSVRLRDLTLGADSVLVSHPINTLQAVANGTTIQIKVLGGQKVIVEDLPVSATSINGSLVNSVLNQAVVQLNQLFTNTLSFDSQGSAVSDFTLSGNNLTIILEDGTSFTQDVTSFGVDENNFVASGALSGSDLILTMDDGTTVTIDASNLVNGLFTNFVPIVADQTVSVIEGNTLNFQIVSSDNIVNQFVEVDAPSWMTLNQNSGVLSGTAPAFAGTSADTIVVNCKAGNAIGGSVDFTVTVAVVEVAYTNTNSLKFGNSTTVLQGNASNVTALQRAANGAGAGDAWSISLWVYPSGNSNQGMIFYYGASHPSTGGGIAIEQFGGNSLSVGFGMNGNALDILGVGNFPQNQWNHLLVTYDGGTTGVDGSSLTDYYSRFGMFVNGNAAITQFQTSGNGYAGSIPSDLFRVGKYVQGASRYFTGKINQIAIWDSNQTANLATIYNAGATQDLSKLTTPPSHYYEIENSVATIPDLSGSANLTGFNFSNSDLVTDTP